MGEAVWSWWQGITREHHQAALLLPQYPDILSPLHWRQTQQCFVKAPSVSYWKVHLVILGGRLRLWILMNKSQIQKHFKRNPKKLVVKGRGWGTKFSKNPGIAKIGLTPHPLILVSWRIWPLKAHICDSRHFSTKVRKSFLRVKMLNKCG